MSGRITKAVFPAAGFGTRFLPVTKALPKEMLPIVDTPGIGQMIAAYEKNPGCYIMVEEVPLERVSQYGILDPLREDGRTVHIRGMVEKPHPEETPSRLGVIGKYIVTPEIFGALERARMPSGELRLIDALRLLLEEGHPVYGYRVEGTRFDTGSKIGFLKATVNYALKHPELAGPFREYLRSLPAA